MLVRFAIEMTFTYFFENRILKHLIVVYVTCFNASCEDRIAQSRTARTYTELCMAWNRIVSEATLVDPHYPVQYTDFFVKIRCKPGMALDFQLKHPPEASLVAAQPLAGSHSTEVVSMHDHRRVNILREKLHGDDSPRRKPKSRRAWA